MKKNHTSEFSSIKRTIRALKRRHLLEEAAHAPAINALAEPLLRQGLEWKEKVESLERELQQCYKAHSKLSDELVNEVADCRAAKALVREKERLIIDLQTDLKEVSEKDIRLEKELDEKRKEVDILISENQSLKLQLEDMTLKQKTLEADNKELLDNLLHIKLKESEAVNEANSIIQDFVQAKAAAKMVSLARKQVDGVVRHREAVYVDFVTSSIPSVCRHSVHAHDGGCGSILFQHNTNKLISGGQDKTVKIWDANTGTLSSTLTGCLGSVLDLTITHDDKLVIAASSSNNLYVWEVSTGRIPHTLTGHSDKVCAVDASRVSNRNMVSAAYDRTIKLWDLTKGYCTNTIVFPSNCNALSYGRDGLTFFSGHVDGNLRMWDTRTEKLIGEVAAHSGAITSVYISRSGNMVLTSGRDNLHNLFDIRTLEVSATFRANGNKIATNWSRSCISADENCVAAGSADGSVYLWSRLNDDMPTVLDGSSPILSCSWSEFGEPLASADKSGNLCIWF